MESLCDDDDDDDDDDDVDDDFWWGMIYLFNKMRIFPEIRKNIWDKNRWNFRKHP